MTDIIRWRVKLLAAEMSFPFLRVWAQPEGRRDIRATSGLSRIFEEQGSTNKESVYEGNVIL